MTRRTKGENKRRATRADEHTLTCRNWRVPGVVAIGGLFADSCGLPNKLVPPVARPAHHAVKMTPSLAHYKAVLWGVGGTAVHRYSGQKGEKCGTAVDREEESRTREIMRMKARKEGQKVKKKTNENNRAALAALRWTFFITVKLNFKYRRLIRKNARGVFHLLSTHVPQSKACSQNLTVAAPFCLVGIHIVSLP